MTPLLGDRTGIGNVVAGWYEGLSSRGDVDLVPFTVSGRDRSGAGVGAVALPLPAGIAHRLWWAFDRPRSDGRLGHPDLVHGTNYLVPPARSARLVSVYDLSFVHDPAAAGDQVARFDRYVGRAIDRGAAVHTTSHHVAGELAERYGVSAHVVMPGLDAAPPVAGHASSEHGGPPTIVAIGTATRRKNFPLLVAAYSLVARQVPDVRLVIAGGDSDDSQNLRSAVAHLSPELSSRVELVGRVADTEPLYRRATVLAHPSSYEGFGIPVLEAMARGVPVVAAAGGAVPEVAGDAADVVPVDDVDSLAAALVRVIDDDMHRAGLIDAGHQRAMAFSWESSVAEMVDLYRAISG